MGKAIERHEPAPLAERTFDPGALMAAIIEKGITAESVAVMKDLVALHRELEADRAKRDFAAAMAALQADARPVPAMKAVPNKDGTLRYHFAPYEDVMRAVAPLLERHGFSVDFTMRVDGPRAVAVCTLTHTGGHSKSNECALRIGGGPPGANEAQSDAAARSMARRLALCDALNIVVERDSDARVEGGTISADRAADLERRAKALGPDQERRLLKLAGVQTWPEVREAKAAVVEGWLRKAAKPVPAPVDAVDPPHEDAADQDPPFVSKPVPPMPCNASEAADWRAAMIEAMKGMGIAQPERAFTKGIGAKGYSSYLAVPVEARKELWASLHNRHQEAES